MSSADATPSSSIRIASRPSATPNRLEAKPGESLTTIGSFPSALANVTARSTDWEVVCGWVTTSTSFMACTGLKKCMPTTRPGSRAAAAIAATESEEVLVASKASAGAARSTSAKTCCLEPRCSRTASITTSASSTAGAKSDSACRRPAAASRSRSEEHTSELQSHSDLVCRLLLEKKKNNKNRTDSPQRTTQNTQQ